MKDEKVSSALAHWEHGEHDGIATESRRNRDGIPMDFSSEFCQDDILSQFRHGSVVIPSIPRIFHGSNGFLMQPGFLFLHVPSVLGPN